MNENKHTPEPWRTAERSGFPFHIDDARGESVAVMLADDDHDEQRGLDNARRIVACVNACAGIPNEQLECDNVEFVRIFNERNTLKQQRDELLAALEEALPMVPCGSFDAEKLGELAAGGHQTAAMILRHSAAIASAKGGAE